MKIVLRWPPLCAAKRRRTRSYQRLRAPPALRHTATTARGSALVDAAVGHSSARNRSVANADGILRRMQKEDPAGARAQAAELRKDILSYARVKVRQGWVLELLELESEVVELGDSFGTGVAVQGCLAANVWLRCSAFTAEIARVVLDDEESSQAFADVAAVLAQTHVPNLTVVSLDASAAYDGISRQSILQELRHLDSFRPARVRQHGLMRLPSFVYETHRLSIPWCKLLTFAVSPVLTSPGTEANSPHAGGPGEWPHGWQFHATREAATVEAQDGPATSEEADELGSRDVCRGHSLQPAGTFASAAVRGKCVLLPCVQGEERLDAIAAGAGTQLHWPRLGGGHGVDSRDRDESVNDHVSWSERVNINLNEELASPTTHEVDNLYSYYAAYASGFSPLSSGIQSELEITRAFAQDYNVIGVQQHMNARGCRHEIGKRCKIAIEHVSTILGTLVGRVTEALFSTMLIAKWSDPQTLEGIHLQGRASICDEFHAAVFEEGQALRGDGLRSYPPWAGRCCTLLRSAWLTPMSNRFSLQCRSGTWWRCASPMTECECWLLSTWTEAFEETSLRYEFGLGIRALTSGRRGGDGGGGGGGAGDGALLLLLLLLLLLPDTGFKSCQMHKPAAR
ncbi:MRL1 [Symbiodinium microadriaticum]|nr:MRL1 [Symbiodinium microadriaticum]